MIEEEKKAERHSNEVAVTLSFFTADQFAINCKI